MRRSSSLVLLLGLVYGCGQSAQRAATQSVGEGTKFYDTFTVGDPTTDQAAGAPGAHSSLIGTADVDGADIQDDDFAQNVAAPALRQGASLFYSFGECYSGGLLDDVLKLGGTQAAMSAARHTETASYAYEAPSGVDIDYTDAFIAAFADGNVPAEQIAEKTALVNPFGPNPDAHRIDEPADSEHVQFGAVGGAETLKLRDHAANGMAVLWAGQPAERDGVQMNRMIDRLVAMGFARDKIWLMYGGGQAPATHPIVQRHIKDQDHPVNLLAATREQLVRLFQSSFAPDAPGGAPSFVFFYVGDHGGLNGEAIAKRHFGAADTLVTPMLAPQAGTELYGYGTRDFTAALRR